MSEVPPAVGLSTVARLAPDSAPVSEKNATSPASPSASASPKAANARQRSCIVCRKRKVRCDKSSPCSNCRRANIPCVVPSSDRPPKWARRLEHLTNNAVSTATAPRDTHGSGVVQLMERLRTLEGLVKELNGQLEHANATATSAAGGRSLHQQDTDAAMVMPSPIDTTGMRKNFGRLVPQDSNRSHYVSSGFWSRVNDEVRRSLFGVVILFLPFADLLCSLKN